MQTGLIGVPGSGRCGPSLVVWRSSELRWRVAQKLALQWSPQQISGWLKQEFPTHQDMQLSHEAIYRSLFIQTRGVLNKELTAQLPTARRMRRPEWDIGGCFYLAAIENRGTILSGPRYDPPYAGIGKRLPKPSERGGPIRGDVVDSIRQLAEYSSRRCREARDRRRTRQRAHDR